MLGDIVKPRVMYIKAALFVAIGLLSSAILLLESPTLRTLLLLIMAIWGFCRAYYFAFYVISHYVDPSFRFSGLFSFARYVLTTGRRR